MFQVEIDKSKNLLKLAFTGHVTQEESSRWRDEIKTRLADLQPGFNLLTDFTGMDAMDFACAPDIEIVMEMCNQAGISKIIRIIPDPRKDIGMSIMSLFHYRRGVAIVTCETMEEALRALAE